MSDQLNFEQAQVEQPTAVEPDVLDVEAETPKTDLAVVEHSLAVDKARMQAAIHRAQAQIEFMEGLRRLIIATARPGHWTRFGNRVVPDGPECHRMRTVLGITVTITQPQRYDYDDEDGKYYVYACTGRAELAPLPPVEGYGAASSRTAFFAKSHGEYLSPRDVNPAFIAKMAWTDCHSKLIQSILALKVDPDELKGITGETPRDNAPKGERNQSAGDNEEQVNKRAAVRAMILELAGGKAAAASAFLAFMTTFKAKDGKWVAGKKTTDGLTQKQVERLYDRRDQDLTPAAFAKFQQQRASNVA